MAQAPESAKRSMATMTDGAKKESLTLRKRRRTLEGYERRIPYGWEIDRNVVKALKSDIRKNEMVPPMKPMLFPPSMLPGHVLDGLHSVVKGDERALVDRRIAEVVLEQTGMKERSGAQINVVLLQNGPSKKNVPLKWCKMRLLGDRWMYNEKRTAYKFEKDKVTVKTSVADVSRMGPTCRQLISEASVYVIVVECLTELHSILASIAPVLKQAFPESCLTPPFVCLTSFSREVDSDEEEQIPQLQSEAEEIEQCFRKLKLRVGIKTISITEHITQLIQQLYHKFCAKWMPEADRNSTVSEAASVAVPVLDPFARAVFFLKSGLMVRYK